MNAVINKSLNIHITELRKNKTKGGPKTPIIYLSSSLRVLNAHFCIVNTLPQICLLFGLTCCPASIGTMPSLLPELTLCSRKSIANKQFLKSEGGGWLVNRHPNISFALKELFRFDDTHPNRLGNSVFLYC